MEKIVSKMQTPFAAKKPPAGLQCVVKKQPTNLQCVQCNKTFTRSWLLKNHQRIHTGERPYKCSFCDKAFADKSNLRQHAKIHTTKEKLFQCTICQKTFAQRRYLMKHATEIHRDVQMNIVGEDGKSTKNSGPTKYIVQRPDNVIVTAPEAAQTAIGKGKIEASNNKVTVKQKLSDSQPALAIDKEKKYSEQDLKDFIKSSHKTMEKNGYIFIKQNFETLDTDTEPTLTEISEIPVQAISDTLKLGEGTLNKGNQLLKVNGRMVYLQMENKPATREEILEAARVKDAGKGKGGKTDAQSKVAGAVKGGKKVVAKNTYVRRHANILKNNSAKKGGQDLNSAQTLKPVSVPNMVRNVMKCVNPLQIMAKQEPLTLLQVLPLNHNSEQPLIIPMSVYQNVHVLQNPNVVTFNPQVSQQCGNNSVQNIKITNVNNANVDVSVHKQDTAIQNTVVKPEVVEIQQLHTIDEKGAASELTGTSVSSTPIVSDAPWQGVLNINSEQELMEYINSQSNTGVESEQNYTIFIQNVDTQNGAVLSSLDSQSLLSSSGSLSSVFTDQGTMISDILPVVSNVEDAQVHSNSVEESEMIGQMLDGGDDQMNVTSDIANDSVVEIKTDDQLAEADDGELIGVDKIIKIEIDPSLVEISEHSDIPDDSVVLKMENQQETGDQCDEMLVEVGREHLSDTDESQDRAAGHLLIKEDLENESEALTDPCITEEIQNS